MTYGPNSIHHKILFIRKNGISKQLADFFNLSLITGVFPSVLKTAKVVPAFKKNSKLYCNYRLIYLSSNIEKKTLNDLIVKKTVYLSIVIITIVIIIMIITCSLDSGNNILHSLPWLTWQNIRKALDDGNKSYGVFVDF